MSEIRRYVGPATGRANGRPSKAKGETLCTTCNQIVGVTITPWNRSKVDVLAKTSAHTVDGRRCGGSLLSVPDALVFPAGSGARAHA